MGDLRGNVNEIKLRDSIFIWSSNVCKHDFTLYDCKNEDVSTYLIFQ